MKPYKIALITVAVAVSTAGGVALATEGMSGKPCPMQGGHDMHQKQGGDTPHKMHQARMDEKLSALKDELALRSEQQQAWQTFEQRVRAQAEGHGPDPEHSSRKDPLQARIAHMEQRVEHMKVLAEAREELFAALSPEQAERMRGFFGGKRH